MTLERNEDRSERAGHPRCRTGQSGGLALLIALALAAPASASVIPISPGYFGASATVEAFEGIAGVDLPLISYGTGFISPMSQLPSVYSFPSGATVSSGASEARVFDYAMDPPDDGNTWGWGLSLDGGDISRDTPLPSGTAFFVLNDGFDDTMPAPTIGFSFPTPVSGVGAYFEASKFIDIGFDGSVVIEAFDASNASLGSASIITDGVTPSYLGPPFPNGLDTWLGVRTMDGAPSIARIEVTARGFAMDDLTYSSVPAPAGAFAFVGAGTLAGRRRR